MMGCEEVGVHEEAEAGEHVAAHGLVCFCISRLPLPSFLATSPGSRAPPRTSAGASLNQLRAQPPSPSPSP